MRLFGFDITRVSKLDKTEERVFKTVVVELSNAMLDYDTFLEHLDLDHFGTEESSALFDIMQTIQSLFNIYENNKFSYPSSCFPYAYHMCEMQKQSAALQKQMSFLHKIQAALATKNAFIAAKYGDDEDFEQLEHDDERILDMEEQVMDRTRYMVHKIQTHLDVMQMIIKSDLMKVIMGVDVIRDYRDRQHRMKHANGYDANAYTISFTRIQNKQGGNKQ